MLKKIIFSIIFFSSILGASAQNVPGSWKVIPMSGLNFDYVQDTPDKVYYLTGGSLYSFDKDSQETLYYSPGVKISDSGIKMIRYNGDKKYMLLAYNNGNIDLIYDSGKVVNLSEIKDANLTAAKSINDVKFGKDRIYVATSFGIVVFDDIDHHVVESGIFNENIPVLFEMGDYLVLWRKNSDGGYDLAYSPKKERHNSLEKFTTTSHYSYNSVTPVSNDSYIILDNSGNVVRVTIDFSSPTPVFSSSNVVTLTGGKKIDTFKDGYYVAGSNGFYILDSKGNYVEKKDYPVTYGSQNLSFWNSPSLFWAADGNGIGSFTLSGGVATADNAKYFPMSSKQKNLWYATNHPNGKQVYISGCYRTDFFPNISQHNEFLTEDSYRTRHELYNWETGEITPVYPHNEWGDYTGGSSRVLFHPENPDYVLMGSLFYGLCMNDNKGINILQIDESKSPLDSRWGSQIYDMAFDNQGNLWMMLWLINSNAKNGSVASPIKILTKEGVSQLLTNPAKVSEKAVDSNGKTYYPAWLQPETINGLLGKYDNKLIFSSKSNKGIAFYGDWGMKIVGIDNKGTTDINDDVYVQYNGFRDQDGTVSSPTYECWVVEDKNGEIWIGTNIGVYVVKDINQIADGSSNYLDVVRPKVARNDGTNYADYLLSSDNVLNIAVDSNNRKWIATSTSGLYCVSADGSEIIHEFNKDNSPLVSNVVTMVTCDPYGNEVLIGTPEGLFVYSSDSAPAQDDYSNVYAFPNPVRPDYSGWITINGLMDNSHVKVADASGNVIWSANSEGGMAVWDGCDASGNRVRSGVYMVLASQKDGKEGAVTKIVVIN